MIGVPDGVGARAASLLLLTTLLVVGCRAQEGSEPAEPVAVDNPLPHPYGHVPGLLTVQVGDLSETEAKAFLAEIGYEVHEVRLTAATVWGVLDAPLDALELEELKARPDVVSARHLKPPSEPDAVRLVVGCAPGMMLDACEEVLRERGIEILKGVKMPQEYTIETPEGRERDIAWKLMQTYPERIVGARYVVL